MLFKVYYYNHCFVLEEKKTKKKKKQAQQSNLLKYKHLQNKNNQMELFKESAEI